MAAHYNRRIYAGPLPLISVAAILLLAALWAWPKYRVYSQEMSGGANLKEAEWSKQILIEEAKAQGQAALLKAQAKVTLAKAQGQGERRKK